MFDGGRILTVQMVRPEGRIEVTQQFDRLSSWHDPMERLIPRERHVDIRLSGPMMGWDPRSGIYRPEGIESATRSLTSPRKAIEE